MISSFKMSLDFESDEDISTEFEYDDSYIEDEITENLKRILVKQLQLKSSNKQITECIKLYNENSPISLPTNIRAIKKHLKINIDFEYYINCKKCGGIVSSTSNKIVCPDCNINSEKTIITVKSLNNFFIYIPVLQQIEFFLNQNFDDILNFEKTSNDRNTIRDIKDSKIYNRLKAKHHGKIVYSLTLNTDGVKVFESSHRSLWPIQLYQNCIPPKKRFRSEYIILAGLQCKDAKPNMYEFLFPLLNEISTLEKQPIKILHDNTVYEIIIVISHAVFDLPAKVQIQMLNQYNGKFSCSFCKHPGIPKKLKKNNKKTVYRYGKHVDTISLRTNQETLMTASTVDNPEKPIEGVKGFSCLTTLDNFDIIESIPIDYMHCIPLGVFSKYLNLLLGPGNVGKNFKISTGNRQILIDRIKDIKRSSCITYRPKSLEQRSSFRAIELRNFLLYYVRFLFNGILPHIYVLHLELLSSATFILLKDVITLEEIEKARDKLNTFCDQFEEYFELDNVTMNLHLLRPIWANSMFGFEANHAVLKGYLHGSTDIVSQIADRYILQKIISRGNMDTVKAQKLREKIEFYTPSELEKYVLKQFGIVSKHVTGKIAIQKVANFKNTQIKSKLYKTRTTIDYFVQIKPNLIAAVHFFF